MTPVNTLQNKQHKFFLEKGRPRVGFVRSTWVLLLRLVGGRKQDLSTSVRFLRAINKYYSSNLQLPKKNTMVITNKNIGPHHHVVPQKPICCPRRYDTSHNYRVNNYSAFFFSFFFPSFFCMCVAARFALAIAFPTLFCCSDLVHLRK